jgi:hypothetical protein
MRYNEFNLTEEQVRNIARRRYPDLTEEQLDEVLPAVAAAVGKVAGGAAKMAGKAAVGVAKAAGNVGMKMAKGAVQAAGKATKGAVQSMAQKAAGKVAQKAQGQMAQAILKPGAKLPMPGADGKEQEFEVDNVKGAEVTLKNPQPKTGEPIKTVHNKKDLDPIIQQMTGV